jgi:hypothetical protein
MMKNQFPLWGDVVMGIAALMGIVLLVLMAIDF